MSIPDYQTLMLPILRIAAEGETSIPAIENRLADEFSLTPDERKTLLPSGRQKLLHNRMHWAKSYMAKAGLLETPRRGRFFASEEGRTLLARNPLKIDVDLLLHYPKFREFYRSGSPASSGQFPDIGAPTVGQRPVPTVKVTPEEQIEVAHAEMQSALRGDLISRIYQNSPAFFEQLIIDLLVAMGYGGSHRNAAKQLGGTGDGGVDGVINEDRLGLDRVYVQAKRYASSHSIGRPDVQAFVGSLVGFGATKGVFVTTSSFSSQATDFVKHLPQRVILIDGQQLADLMIEHNVGVRIARLIEFKRLDEDFFTEDD